MEESQALAVKGVLAQVETELARGMSNHRSSFNSAHEGYAVILEELDELWEEVKKCGGPFYGGSHMSKLTVSDRERKYAEKWRPLLETDKTRCGSPTCLGNGKDQWGTHTLSCPLWEAARVLGLTPGRGHDNTNARLTQEGKEPLLFQ